MSTDAATAPVTRTPPWWAYVWWGVVGALLGFGVAALLTVGIVFLLAGVLLTVVGALVPALRNRSAVAIPSGVACLVLYLAWLNRDGPGNVCQTTGLETRCVDEYSPWPFLIAAVVLVATSVAMARALRKSVVE